LKVLERTFEVSECQKDVLERQLEEPERRSDPFRLNLTTG
jgi:hypothetical protein